MARRLNDRFARAAAAPTDGKPYHITWDNQIRGFGLRTTRGAKSWVLNYRSRGTERRLTIGSFPAWNARQAREGRPAAQVGRPG
jgi:Arm DNA-binding domain